MAAAQKDAIKALMTFTGLDSETVSSQILPYLQSISARSELETHLQGLLGGGTEQNAFVRRYVDGRFPPKPTPVPKASETKGRGRRQASTPKPSPPVVQQADTRSSDLATLGATFGSGGSLYVKNRDEALFAGSGGKKGKRGGGSTPASGSATPVLPASGRASPVPAASLAPPPPQQPEVKHPSPSASPKPAEPAAATPVLSAVTIPLSDPAATHLSRLDSILHSLFNVSSKAPSNPNPCHCSTRLHPAPLPPLPSICPRCALPLCHLTPPLGPCPSCAQYPLIEAGFVENLRVWFGKEREELIEKEKRAAEAKAKREKDEAAKERFPELSGRGSPSNVPTPRGYASSAGGGPSLDTRIAQGYARMEAQGRAKKAAEEAARKEKEGPRTVLRLTKDGKTKLVTTAPAAASSSSSAAKSNGANAAKAEKGWIDENDDGWRRQKGLQPLLSTSSTSAKGTKPDDKVLGNPRRRLKYVPPRTYETESAGTAE